MQSCTTTRPWADPRNNAHERPWTKQPQPRPTMRPDEGDRRNQHDWQTKGGAK